MKRAFKYLRRFVATIIVLVILAVGFLHTPWGKSVVRARIEARLAAPFEGRATIGSLDYGFLFSSVTLENVVIKDRAGRTAVAIAAIRADIDRGSVLSGNPVIDALAIEGLELTVVEDAKGVSNLVGIATPSTTRREPLASITVSKLVIDGAASITKADGTHIGVTELVVAGSITARPRAKEGSLELTTMSAKLRLARPNVPVRELDLSIAGATLGKRGSAIDADVRGIVAGAASIEAITGHLDFVDGVPTGPQALAITKLRIDRTKLHTLLGRELLGADVGIDATLTGPPNALIVHGAVTSRATTLALDGTIDASHRLRPSYHLTLVGTGTSSDVLPPALRARRSLPEIATSLEIDVVGAGVVLADLEAAVQLKVGATTIGNVAVAGVLAKATIAHGAYTLDSLSATGLGFEISAQGTIDARAVMHGTLTVRGAPAEALRVLHDAGIEVPQRIPRILPVGRIALTVTADGSVAGDLTVTLAPTRVVIAGGTIEAAGTATLTDRIVSTAATRVTIRRLDLGAVGRLAGRPALRGSLSGTLALAKTRRDRSATFDVAVALPTVVVHAKGRADTAHASVVARVAGSDRTTLATIAAELPLDAVGLVPSRPWHLVIDAPSRPIAELIALAPPALRAKLPVELTGTVEIHGDLTGTPSAPRGTIVATVTGPRAGELRAVIAPSADHQRLAIQTTGEVSVVDPRDGRSLAATLSGSVSIPRLVVAHRRISLPRPLDLRIDETLAFADRPVGEMPRVPPKLAALGGTVGGTVRITGAPKALVLDGSLAWRGYRVASGGTADTTLALTGSPTQFDVSVTHAGAVTLAAAVSRSADRIDVAATARADAPLLSVLPALPAVAAISTMDVGTLHWDMRANIGIRTRGERTVDRADVSGTLAIRDASFALPQTKRRWHDINLEVAGDPGGVRLVRLDARETDRERSDRSLHVEGMLAIEQPTFRPTSLALTLTTKNWLVLGLTPAGLADAPTGTLDLQARIAADLTAAIKTIDVTVDKLALRSPDRHDRAHQPERASVAGDVIFVDADHAAGALPVHPVKAAPMAPASAPSLDVHVHLATPAQITRSPLDVTAQGDIALSLRPGQPIAPVGTLRLVSGSILLFGFSHPLVDGTIQLSAEHPTGLLDLRFERPLPDAAMRDRANAAAGARITLKGAPSKPDVRFSGAANATLPEVFALYDAGRSVFAPRPTTYASTMAQTPRGDQINILAFVSLALPHLLVLDRASSWSDASEPRGAYGRIRNLELDRYTRGDSTRFRVIGRPRVPGRSTGELQLEHLFLHDRRKAFGVGLRAGDRLGGGVGLVFDWSSD